MDQWILRKTGADPENTASDGNRFLCANGYMGMRGTAEEDGPEMFAAVTLAGVYDRNGDRWREPVNAPHGLSVRLLFDGKELKLLVSLKGEEPKEMAFGVQTDRYAAQLLDLAEIVRGEKASDQDYDRDIKVHEILTETCKAI